MSTKHVFDSPDSLVIKSLRGAVALNPALRLHPPSKSVYVASPSPNLRVAVISGGGAGHEPAHGSYTGDGMLAASVSGDIFASPSSKQILAAIQFAAFVGDNTSHNTSTDLKTNGKREVLAIINNYTGDRLNFGLAIEKAHIAYPDLNITSVVVSDDVSLINRPSLVGARGLAGNILVCKILGAAAARGWELHEVKMLGDVVVANLASVGVGMEHCHIPGRKNAAAGNQEASKLLSVRECEIGMGLHNEPGVRKVEMKGPELLMGELVEMILNSREGEFVRRDEVASGVGDEVVLFVNNLGGMSQLEMGAVVDETLTQLEKVNIYPIRIYSSSYMTSLNAPGFSISLLNITRVHNSISNMNTKVQQLLDDPTSATSWLGVRSHWPSTPLDRNALEAESSQFLRSLRPAQDPSTPASTATSQDAAKTLAFWRQADISPAAVTNAMAKACEKVLSVESDLTRFDTVIGDGDCGDTFGRGARAVLAAIKNQSLDVGKMSPSALVQTLADILEEKMGGTIGALFSLFFTSWSNALRSLTSSSTSTWPTALSTALTSLSHYTPARPGDRTIIDALSPFCASLTAGQTLEEAVKAAKDGAASTKGMKAKLGRATYVGNFGRADIPTDDNQERGKVVTNLEPNLTTVAETAGQPEALKHVTDAAGQFVQNLHGGRNEGIGAQMVDVPKLEPRPTTIAKTASLTIKNVAVAAGEFVESMNGEASADADGGKDEEAVIPPDPGAWGVAAIVEGIYEGLSGLKVAT